MYKDKTIVISCAGMGKRLGMGMPKALIKIDGKPLIIRHLEMLKDCEDIRVVVGYKAEDVIKVVKEYRKDVTFVFNHDYMNNGTGASVMLATNHANKFVITLDGDLLIHPDDMNKILEYKRPFVGVCKASTDEPWLTRIENEQVVEFTKKEGQYEWTGVCQFEAATMKPGTGHVFQLLEPYLPMDYLFLRTKEIDTPNDYENAIRWVKNNFSDNITIGVVGGMGSVATVNYFERLVDCFPAEKEWERPRIIIDNRCSMPSRVRAALYNERYEELVHSLINSVKMLSDNGCDFIVLSSNTSHLFLNEIYKKIPDASEKIINIIELCARKLVEKNIKKVKLLVSEGTILSGVYAKIFRKYKIKIAKIDESDFLKLREWIEAIKQQKISRKIMEDFVNYINDSKTDTIILGSTELPVLYSKCKKRIYKNVCDPFEFVLEFLLEKQKERI